MKARLLAACAAVAVLASLMLAPAEGRAASGGRQYERSVQGYAVPDVVLVDQNGKRVRLQTLLAPDRPVIVDFIYGTCTTICPVLSAGYVNLQDKLGGDSRRIQLVSVSIDPENDTPKVMREYLRRYQARPGWDFLTGSRENIDAVMRAFDAYVPNKMSHKLLTFIRSPRDGKWIRISGMMSTAEFVEECRKAGIE